MLTPERKAELRRMYLERFWPDTEKTTDLFEPIDLDPDGPEIGYLRQEYATDMHVPSRGFDSVTAENGPFPVPLDWMAM